ncbi:hypothetical protein [Microbispora amethystogenes]|uniref:Uncharacterized protein n=1 Tax=Microbispora amethystogenes TaxID=1427754 RepID=A0ABQ4FCS5_9ACTN|nr:hypothetical protein [Microbispora amethystogenes]GIH32565.1 hypothetical protein Mam01_27290 [Microbispora amethystogenes]
MVLYRTQGSTASAMARSERLDALIIQNAVAHHSGLGPLWQARRAFWAAAECIRAFLDKR